MRSKIYQLQQKSNITSLLLTSPPLLSNYSPLMPASRQQSQQGQPSPNNTREAPIAQISITTAGASVDLLLHSESHRPPRQVGVN